MITATATGRNGPKTATHTVTITPVATPVFAIGATFARCQGAGPVTYTATASTTGITYRLTEQVLQAVTALILQRVLSLMWQEWRGTSMVTAMLRVVMGHKLRQIRSYHPDSRYAGICIRIDIARCQGAGLVTYTASATTTTGITYRLDGTSIRGGNTINASTGDVTFAAGWCGTTTITATATGCNGPKCDTYCYGYSNSWNTCVCFRS